MTARSVPIARCFTLASMCLFLQGAVALVGAFVLPPRGGILPDVLFGAGSLALWALPWRGGARSWQLVLLVLPFFAADALVDLLTRPGKAGWVAAFVFSFSLGAFTLALVGFRRRRRTAAPDVAAP